MTLQVLESWILLIHCELLMRLRGLAALQKAIRKQSVSAASASDLSSEELCRAMDLACVFYFRRVQCLQRSASTTLLLRRHGRFAEMVTGTQILPFRSHAWVEIDGTVVNDKPYMHDIYQVLDRC